MLRSTHLLVAILALCCAGGANASQGNEGTQAKATAPSVDTGVLGNAPYRIDIPAGWNGKLVMLLHGYEPKGVPRQSPMPPNEATAIFLADGYAVAQTAYASQGWAISDAIPDTERLRQHFQDKHGKPEQTFAVGFSLGGHVALASLEQHGGHYNGGLSLCGANVPASRVFDDTLTSLVAFDYFFPGVVGLPKGGIADPTAPAMGQMEVLQAAELALQGNEALAGLLATRLEVARPGLSGLISLHYLLWSEMRERSGGVPVDNRTTAYAGFGDDAALNKGVRRHAGDEAAIRYLSEASGITGNLLKPAVLQYNNNDPTIAPRYTGIYPALVESAGGKANVVVLPSVGDGHCDFTPEQVSSAFKVLTDWSNSGLRPAAP